MNPEGVIRRLFLSVVEPAVQRGFIGPEPVQDALGVVQPVHPEQNDPRVSQFGPDLPGAGVHVRPPGEVRPRRPVDGDGKAPDAGLPSRAVTAAVGAVIAGSDLVVLLLLGFRRGTRTVPPVVVMEAARRHARRKLVASDRL